MNVFDTRFGVVVLIALVAGCGGSRQRAAPPPPPKPVRANPKPKPPSHLWARVTGRLDAPLQDAATAVHDGRIVLLGGLSAADTSTTTILHATAIGARAAGALPHALHDAAAATLGGRVYLFGGGDGVAQLDQILQTPSTLASHLPAPSSDQAAATIGRTAYIVGGYTGTRWLDTIVAYSPQGGARVVARLPTPIRYAAVTAADGRLIVAGGSLPSGSASETIYAWTPGAARVRAIGRLPAPTTHAAGAALRGMAYIIGGRGAALGSATNRIVAVDPRSG